MNLVHHASHLTHGDGVCLPTRRAYCATRAAWSALVVVLEASKVGTVTDLEVEDAGRKLRRAFADLRQAIGGMK